MIKVSSTTNSKYKYIKALMAKKARMQNREYTVEGIKSVSDAINSGADIKIIAVSESFFENNNFRCPEGVELIIVSDAIFEPLCDTKLHKV